MPTQSEGVAHIAATGRARRRPFPLAVNAPPNGPACWWAAPRVTRRPLTAMMCPQMKRPCPHKLTAMISILSQHRPRRLPCLGWSARHRSFRPSVPELRYVISPRSFASLRPCPLGSSNCLADHPRAGPHSLLQCVPSEPGMVTAASGGGARTRGVPGQAPPANPKH